MNALTKLFVPSGKKFYDLFELVADNLKQMSEQFAAYVTVTDRVQRRTLLDKIERLENKNDEATHKLFVELGRNFITPFDREDIHYMATTLDDVADTMWAAAKQMYYYDVDRDSSAKALAERLTVYISKLGEAVRGLRNRKDLNALIAILGDMRNLTYATDAEVSATLSALFDDNTDAVEMIKLSDHYNMLLALNNKCGDLINVLEGVIIKYA